MPKVTRMWIALFVFLAGAALVPYIALPAERLTWQTYAGVYEPPVEVSIENLAFVPPVVYVPPTTQVRWTNNDTVPHTVTSDPPGLFDSGTLQPGESFEFRFEETGDYGYICTLHPSMRASVVVSVEMHRVFLPLASR